MRTYALIILFALTCAIARRRVSAHSAVSVASEPVRVKECKDSPNGIEYRGTMSQTRQGFTCQAWASKSPHTHEFVVDSGDGSALNHCRNPDGGKEPWCFTVDPKKTYDYCDVPFCEPEERMIGLLSSASRPSVVTKARTTVPDADANKVPNPIIDAADKIVSPVSADVNEENVLTRTENNIIPPSIPTVATEIATVATEIATVATEIATVATEIAPTDKVSTTPKKVSTAVKGFKIDSNRGRLSHKGRGFRGSYKPTEVPKEKVDSKKKDDDSKPISDVGGEKPAAVKTEDVTQDDKSDGDMNTLEDFRVIPESKQGECKLTRRGKEYAGTLNKTRHNYTCQMWASNSPHEVIRAPKNKTAASNYCRNPTRKLGPWCYTTDPKRKIDMCDIPLCVGARSGKTKGYKLKNKICGKSSYARGTNVAFGDCKKECNNDKNCKSFCYTTPFASKPPKSECQLFETSCEGFLAAPKWPKSMGMEDMLIPHHYIKK